MLHKIELENKTIEAIGLNIIEDILKERNAQKIPGELTIADASFLAGIIRLLMPSSAIEIGVAAGWSSTVILKAASNYTSNFNLTGIDITDRFYRDPSIATGEAVQRIVPELANKYQLCIKASAIEATPTLVSKADFAFIDANHLHPWATFDLIAVLPFQDLRIEM